MSSLHQLRDFASEAFKLVIEAKNDVENRPELIKRFDNLLTMAVDMLEIKDVQQQQHNAISHSFAEELMTRPISFGPSPYFKEPVASFVKESQTSQTSQKSQTKDISVKDSEPTLIIHETVPTVSVVKLNSEACPYPYEHELPQFASLLKHPFQISEIEADGTIDGTIDGYDGPTEDDDVNSEEVGMDAETGEDAKDLEEMEIVEHEGKRYFRGIVSNDVHLIIGDEEAGECVGTYRNGKVILQ